MKKPRHLRCMWSGNSFIPDKPTLAYCVEEFGDGEVVLLERNEERSENSHRHQFAWLNDAWANLPESLMEEYPTVDALRAKALIRTGFCHQRDMVCSSNDEAQRLAAFIQPLNHYAIVEVRNNVIRVYTAKSQSRSAMKKAEFQDSKDKVLQFVSNLIGVTSDKLKENSSTHC